MADAGIATDQLAARRDVARVLADAAKAWLDTLDRHQRETAVGTAPADDASDAERRRWFYTPTNHGGLTFHQQRPAQQRAAMQLVSAGLSTPGYVTVATIMGLENVLDQVEGFVTRFDRERGRDPGLYYLRVLVATTPCFLGADPAVSPLLGGAVNRPLARVEDLARDLIRSMCPDVRARAVLLPRAPSDLVTANRTAVSAGDRVIPLSGIWRKERFPDSVEQARLQALSDAIDDAAAYEDADHAAVEYTVTPKGVAAAELDAEQRAWVRALLATYFDRVPAGVSPTARYADEQVLDAVHFAWAGSTEPGQPHYYRLQAPRLLIEWDNTQRNANHGHSVWRDPVADFGLDTLASHRRAHHG